MLEIYGLYFVLEHLEILYKKKVGVTADLLGVLGF